MNICTLILNHIQNDISRSHATPRSTTRSFGFELPRINACSWVKRNSLRFKSRSVYYGGFYPIVCFGSISRHKYNYINEFGPMTATTRTSKGLCIVHSVTWTKKRILNKIKERIIYKEV